jgi:CubicO group peptidase (beta-lactamase class C family)
MTLRVTLLLGRIAGACLALAALLAASAAAAETMSEKAEALLSGLIETNDPGLVVLVAQDGKILFQRGYGMADMEHHVPVTPQTIFRIASITKQFTAAAILKLQEERKLSINDKLSKFIPDFPRGDEVTLRHLLTHTSGIHNYTDDRDFLKRVAKPTTTEAVIGMIKNYPYDFDPGAKWNYSNSGYMLLSYIVEQVSGQRYEDFLGEKFFQPLGMTNTGVYRTNEALGYSLGKNGFKRALYWDPSWCGGAGVLSSTVEDLYRWNEGIFNGRVLNAASLKAAFTPVKGSEGQVNWDAGYGFGWFVGHYRGLQEISHSGLMSGFRSYLVRLPDEKFTVAILVNTAPGRSNIDPMFLARKLATVFLMDKLTPLPTVNTNVLPKSYDALTGRYNGWGPIMTVSRRGMHLFEQLASGPEREIFPKSDTEFFVKGQDIQFTFVKDSSGKTVKLIFHNYGMDLDAPRVKDTTAQPEGK